MECCPEYEITWWYKLYTVIAIQISYNLCKDAIIQDWGKARNFSFEMEWKTEFVCSTVSSSFSTSLDYFHFNDFFLFEVLLFTQIWRTVQVFSNHHNYTCNFLISASIIGSILGIRLPFTYWKTNTIRYVWFICPYSVYLKLELFDR